MKIEDVQKICEVMPKLLAVTQAAKAHCDVWDVNRAHLIEFIRGASFNRDCILSVDPKWTPKGQDSLVTALETLEKD